MTTETIELVGNTSIPKKDRITTCLYGMLVGDALAVPGHWFYSPTKLRQDYGEISSMMAPKATHAESSESNE
jgi:ADP-ribosyl-[dinitrogen reductase] hydrolase